VTTARRTRPPLVLLLLTVGVILDLLIAFALYRQNVRAEQAASEAHIVKVAAYEYCLKANMDRQLDLRRWDSVLALLKTSPPSSELTTFVAGVEAANAQADQQIDCTKLAP
jgi:hypothetical protein